VTAFREWAAPAEEVLRSACRSAGVEYAIGSGRIDPDIIGSIWDDLCRATHVVVDLTHLNPNAVFELAVAQVLGRPVLVISQDRRVHEHLPVLSRTRVHHYEPGAGRGALTAVVERFLRSPSAS
jgi:hypothetical protein